MTRKKFVKKLMACGMDRDAAVYFAKIVNALGDSYGRVWYVVLQPVQKGNENG